MSDRISRKPLNYPSLAWFLQRGLITDADPLITGQLQFEPTIRLFPNARLLDCHLGAYSYISPQSTLNRVHVGRYCSIGAQCEIGPTQHPADWLTTSPLAYKDVFNVGAAFPPSERHDELSPVTIGNDVWIGSRVAVMGGVTIGDGAIVGYGSVVTKDVAPYSIVGGVPAKLIRGRFDAATIAALQRAPWWRYDVARMRGAPIDWRRPAIALRQIAVKTAAGDIDALPDTLHRITRQNGHQFAFDRINPAAAEARRAV